ncbi:MAG: TetR/AcrR family transcriptional regulator [Polyangiaceae bacterium]
MARTAQLDARREQLLRVGKDVFSDRAYDAVSTEEIAEAAGISIGLLYHYFSSKKGFYVATIRAAADELLSTIQFPAGSSLAMSARDSISRFLDFIEQNARLYVSLMRGGVGADAQVHAIVDDVRCRILSRLLDAANVDPTPSLRLRLHGWVGFVEATTLRWLTHREVERAELVAMLLSSVPDGLMPEARS